jgi:phage gp29-like protein|nr:MAG TPA: portal [Caudoviricetes sp.]
MKLLDKIPYFKNRAKQTKKRITEGGNFRPGTTITLTAPRRFGIGLDDYMTGIKSADNVDFTQRVRLYDVYLDTLLDPHLFSVIQKRKSGVLGRKIEFRRNGVADDRVNEQISSPWFLRFIEDALDAQYWGFTLVQFFINEKGWIDYYCVPRKHVDPVLGHIKHRQDNITGEPFENYNDLLMIRGKEPLGILARTAPYVIYKRGTLGDWAQFSEIFGMPIRVYTYDAADPEARDATMEDADSQGGGSVYLLPDGTKLEFVESGNKTGSSDLYASLVDRCNAEISKAVLGNTLTTEASETGTQALGTVHNKAEQELIEQDALFILNLLNYDMTDQFAALGVNTEGGTFVYVETEDIAATKAKADLLEKAVTVFELPLEDDYLYEQLKIEKPDNYAQLKADMEEKKKASNPFAALPSPVGAGSARPNTQGKGDNGTQPQNRAGSFFAEAPETDGALDW